MNEMITLGATVAGAAWQSWTVPASIAATPAQLFSPALAPAALLLHGPNSRQQPPQ